MRKNKLKFYFRASFFAVPQKGFMQAFWGTTKKYNKKKLKLIFISVQLSKIHAVRRAVVYDLYLFERSYVMAWNQTNIHYIYSLHGKKIHKILSL